ncbi:MAG: alpha/beta fold hydrolase [Lewinella sp.]
MPKIKKRYWALSLFVGLFLMSRCESLKMRYEPNELMASLETRGITQAKLLRDTSITGHLQYLEIDQTASLPLLVMLHGSPGALSAFEPYFTDRLLLDSFSILAIDRPGFGYSDFGTAAPLLADQATAVASVLRRYPNRLKILIGHSMGGPLLARLAMDYPEEVDGMVMVAPSVSPMLEPAAGWRKFVNTPPIRWFTPPALRVCNQEIIPLRGELDKMMPAWEKMEMPVTVVQGTEDELVPMGNAAFVAESINDTSRVKLSYVEGGDHFILWSEVPLIREEILEMLAKIRS